MSFRNRTSQPCQRYAADSSIHTG